MMTGFSVKESSDTTCTGSSFAFTAGAGVDSATTFDAATGSAAAFGATTGSTGAFCTAPVSTPCTSTPEIVTEDSGCTYTRVPTGKSIDLPFTKKPPTRPTGPNKTAPATDAPAAFSSPFVLDLASSPWMAVKTVPSIPCNLSNTMFNFALRPKDLAFVISVIWPVPTVPLGINRVSPSITSSATLT